MPRKIEIIDPAERDLRRLSHTNRERIRVALRRLAEEQAGDVKRLQGRQDE